MDLATDHFYGTQDHRMNRDSAERSAQRDHRSDAIRHLRTHRASQYAPETVPYHVDLSSAFLVGFFNSLDEVLPDQQIGALRIHPDTGAVGTITDPAKPGP